MPLLGRAAMLLSFDVLAEAVDEHDQWHTQEHLLERLSIPGFLRGTRWVAVEGRPRYVVVYEVDDLGTLSSAAYLERLNHPSAWTARLMPSYRDMSRGFCRVTASVGGGVGHGGLFVRFRPTEGSVESLGEWLARDMLPRLVQRRRIGAAHLLQAEVTPSMTAEQRIRGADREVHWAVMVTGYDLTALSSIAAGDLATAEFDRHGARDASSVVCRLDYLMSDRDIAQAH